MASDFEVYLAYSLRPQAPKNYMDFLDPKVHVIQVKNWNGQSIFNIFNDIKVIKELRQIGEKPQDHADVGNLKQEMRV